LHRANSSTTEAELLLGSVSGCLLADDHFRHFKLGLAFERIDKE
jgi:hypothetical protein